MRGRLKGIDSIRAISALVVVLGHLALFAETDLHSSNYLLRASARVSATAWNGPSAVIVFFIISGFCIHLPFRGDRPLHLAPFLSRRLLRVGLPAVIAYLLARYAIHAVDAFNAVIWSVICEVIYYALYPLFLPMAKRLGWVKLFAGAYLISLALALTHLHSLVIAQNAYYALGVSLTWAVGLPCWLLGCWLAENERLFPLLSPSQIWLCRGGVFLLSVALRFVKFHVHSVIASNVLTLNVFALVACAWVGFEIAYYKHRPPSRFLEWIGTWSYSIYLMHSFVIGLLFTFKSDWILHRSTAFHSLALLLAFSLAYLFYWTVEVPSHRLAILISRKV